MEWSIRRDRVSNMGDEANGMFHLFNTQRLFKKSDRCLPYFFTHQTPLPVTTSSIQVHAIDEARQKSLYKSLYTIPLVVTQLPCCKKIRSSSTLNVLYSFKELSRRSSFSVTVTALSFVDNCPADSTAGLFAKRLETIIALQPLRPFGASRPDETL